MVARHWCLTIIGEEATGSAGVHQRVDRLLLIEHAATNEMAKPHGGDHSVENCAYLLGALTTSSYAPLSVASM